MRSQQREFAEHSYGFRPRHGCKDALRRVDSLLKAGYVHVVDADLKSYFDTIPHDRLMARLAERRLAMAACCRWSKRSSKAGIIDSLAGGARRQEHSKERCSVRYSATSIWTRFDHLLAQTDKEMIRYADDFVILCRTAEDAQRALQIVQQWTSGQRLDVASRRRHG